MPRDVFISYAAADQSAAVAVCAALERRQIRCWIAPRDARPGLDYADSIVDALDETCVMVFVVSSRSIASPHVKREVEQAANRGTHVIPFRIEAVELSRGLQYFLGTVHWIDALTPPIDPQLEYLGDAVQYFLDRKSAASAPGPAPAVPREPAPAWVESPSVPPVHETVPTPPNDWSGAAEPIEAHPAAPEFVPAVQPAPRWATDAAPPAFSSDIATPRWDAEVPAVTPELAADPPAGAAPVTWSAVAEPPEGPAQTRPSRLWLIVLCGTLGAVLGAVGYAMLAIVEDLNVISGSPLFTVIVAPAVVTWVWFDALRKRSRSAAVAGGLAGAAAGWLGTNIIGGPFGFTYGAVATADTLQWAAFGVAGGVAAERGLGKWPALSLGIALVCAAVVRPLMLGRLALLGFDGLIAVGWGIGLIACPAATAALREAQIARGAPIAEGAPPAQQG